MTTYATYLDVKPRVAGRTIDSTSKPTSGQVDDWIEEAEAMITGALTSVQCAIPAAGTSGAKIIRSWVCDFAEAHCRQAWIAAIGGPETEGQALLERFFKTIDDIMAKPSAFDAMLNGGGTSSSSRVRSHVLNNRDGLTIENGDFDPKFEMDSDQEF